MKSFQAKFLNKCRRYSIPSYWEYIGNFPRGVKWSLPYPVTSQWWRHNVQLDGLLTCDMIWPDISWHDITWRLCYDVVTWRHKTWRHVTTWRHYMASQNMMSQDMSSGDVKWRHGITWRHVTWLDKLTWCVMSCHVASCHTNTLA